MQKIYFLIILPILMATQDNIIFDFTTNANTSNWRVVDDVVMGGKSNGDFKLNKDGFGEYSGKISLENNGGFSSLRYRFKEKSIKGFSKVILKIKGDGKKYQFRIKKDSNDSHSYISSFSTNGNWQTIEINLSEMYPAFRGRVLDMENLSSDSIEEVAFLIGNKKEEDFRLYIDKISLEK
ncbi:CIA30 family protein [Polaribacter septentrionalilitoris]|uniref:CIA30 family protein n=1 Tax=Polaribacter septentrionalilitoris TaxID=2494657 RepID=UPI00135AB1D1|nr:CIA30 family protein [Polaribacter septentrionalilitoris]